MSANQAHCLPRVKRPAPQETPPVGDHEIGDQVDPERRLQLQEELQPLDPAEAAVAQKDRCLAEPPQDRDEQPEERNHFA